MKNKNIFFAIALLLICSAAIAQPANDNPCTATDASALTGSIAGSLILVDYDGGFPGFGGVANNPTATTPVTSAPYGPNLVYYTGSTSTATNLGINEPTPPCGLVGTSPKTVWFKFKAPSMGSVGVSIRTGYTATSFSTIISAYTLSIDPCTGTPVYTNIGCSTSSTLSLSSILVYPLGLSGQDIYIQLQGSNNTSGNYILSVQGELNPPSLSGATSASLTASVASVAGSYSVAIRWQKATGGGYGLTYVSPSVSTYTIQALQSGFNYNIWEEFINGSQMYYTPFTTLSTVFGCTASPAAPTATLVAGHCSKATITWSAHPLAATVYPYRLYWRKTGAAGFNVVACTTNAYNMTGLALNQPYEFFYRTICSGAGNIMSLSSQYTTCVGPARMGNPADSTAQVLELNGRYFVNADFTDIAAFADTTAADGEEHYIELNKTTLENMENAAYTPITSVAVNNFELFPNPATAHVQVNFHFTKETQPANLVLKIADLQGRIILQKQITQPETGTVSVNTNTLSAGIYLINLSGDGYTATKRLVVAK